MSFKEILHSYANRLLYSRFYVVLYVTLIFFTIITLIIVSVLSSLIFCFILTLDFSQFLKTHGKFNQSREFSNTFLSAPDSFIYFYWEKKKNNFYYSPSGWFIFLEIVINSAMVLEVGLRIFALGSVSLWYIYILQL